MSSVYDPLIPDSPHRDADDLARVQDLFEAASQPFLRSAASWAAWGLILPLAALGTPAVLAKWGALAGLGLWSVAILLGGAIEMVVIRRRRSGGSTPLASWALRAQGNLSLVAVALSALVLWLGQGWALPALWLLLLGHSFYSLGGLAFRPMRRSGLVYQLGGLLALFPGGRPLMVFAMATAVANLLMAWSVHRHHRGLPGVPVEHGAGRTQTGT